MRVPLGAVLLFVAPCAAALQGMPAALQGMPAASSSASSVWRPHTPVDAPHLWQLPVPPHAIAEAREIFEEALMPELVGGLIARLERQLVRARRRGRGERRRERQRRLRRGRGGEGGARRLAGAGRAFRCVRERLAPLPEGAPLDPAPRRHAAAAQALLHRSGAPTPARRMHHAPCTMHVQSTASSIPTR